MPRWAFGDFELDLGTHELTRAGAPISLSPKALQLLGILVQEHPTALARADLQGRLWPGIFVVEKNLTNLVSEIRDALGDDPVHPGFIRMKDGPQLRARRRRRRRMIVARRPRLVHSAELVRRDYGVANAQMAYTLICQAPIEGEIRIARTRQPSAADVGGNG